MMTSIQTGTGLVVTSVEPGSPAAIARLAPLDVVARIGDQMLVNTQQGAPRPVAVLSNQQQAMPTASTTGSTTSSKN